MCHNGLQACSVDGTWLEAGVNSPLCLHFYLLKICILFHKFGFYLAAVSPAELPASTYPRKLSDRRHFSDYITFSRGTTTQAFEEFGFSRALPAFISQELALTLRDAHWSWRPLKENALKKTGGPRKRARFLRWHSIDAIDSFSLVQPKTRRGLMQFVL